MARIRSVKPEFWADEDLAELQRDARLLYIGLWNLSDEHGRLRGDPRYIKGQLFPYDEDLPPKEVDVLLNALVSAKKLVRYTVDGAQYAFLPNLARHQRLDSDKVPSRLPPPAETPDPDSSASESEKIPDESAPRAEQTTLLYVAGSMEQGAWSMEHVDSPESARRSRADAEFDRFWAAYPRREAKGPARKAWDKAILRADPDRILAAAETYRDQPGRDPKFTAHPATWLNGDRWLDERPPPGTGIAIRDGPNSRPSTTDQRVQAALDLATELRQEAHP